MELANILKKSIYNLFYPYRPGNYIVYNTRTEALAIVSSQEKEIYDSAPDLFPDDSLTAQIFNVGFLVHDDFDEKESLLERRIQYSRASAQSYYRVLLTTACNAHCDYCYESGAVIETMSLNTARATARFINNNSIGAKSVLLHAFGGEPTLNIEGMDCIINNLDSSLSYQSIITTNGLLLTDRMLSNIIDRWNLKLVQITLDGYGGLHERKKRFCVPNAFDTIIDNICVAAELGVKVLVRINYNVDNTSSIKELATYLKETIVDTSNIEYQVAPVFCSPHKLSDIQTFPKRKYCSLVEANDILLDNGLIDAGQYLILAPRKGQCYACQEHAFVIDPSGYLYKCAVFTKFGKQASVGSVYDGVLLNDEYDRWVNANLPEQCNSCSYLPICQGGCRAGLYNAMDYCCHRAIPEIGAILKRKIELSHNSVSVE